VLSIFTFFVLLSTFSPSFAATITYQYNALNRLESVNSGNGCLETYTYDGIYNRTSLTVEDVEPPTATIISNQIIISDGETTISGTASDPGSGVQKVEIFFDGGSIQITYTRSRPSLHSMPVLQVMVYPNIVVLHGIVLMLPFRRIFQRQNLCSMPVSPAVVFINMMALSGSSLRRMTRRKGNIALDY